VYTGPAKKQSRDTATTSAAGNPSPAQTGTVSA